MSKSDSASAECVFCAIVSRAAPAREVFRSDGSVAFFPDHPAVLGHTIVVPRVHVPDLMSLDRSTAHIMTDAVRKVVPAVLGATGSEGLNVIQSNGRVAGQTVFHLHVHLVPRRDGDRMPELWPADRNWPSSDLDHMMSVMRGILSS